MKYFSLFILVTFFIIGGCNHPANQSVSNSWSTLIITSEHREVIRINNDDDTTIVKYNDFGSFFTGYHKVKVDSLKTYFTRAEKDSLFRLSQEIIANPVKPKRGCTEFIGDIELVIDYGTYGDPGACRQSIEYNGVCEWDTLSEKAMRLSKILYKKINWPKKN
jgi:hypothetical protein